MRAFQAIEATDEMNVAVVEAPVPVPGPGQVLVRVAAAALNPLDYKIASAVRGGRTFPMTLGFDVVGTVERCGEEVSPFMMGDRVMAMAHLDEGGTAAEFVVLPEEVLAAAPPELEDPIAAALPLASLTAEQALERAGVGPETTLLIHAGAGGVGHYAIQLAKRRGAEVHATSSEKNLDVLARLGADHPIDYRSTPVARFAQHVDVVLDAIGGQVALDSLRAMKDGGVLVSLVGTHQHVDARRDGVTVDGFQVQPDGGKLAELAALAVAGDLHTLVHSVSPLDFAPRELRELREGHTVGKRVLTVP